MIQSVLSNSPPVGKGSQGGLLGRMDNKRNAAKTFRSLAQQTFVKHIYRNLKILAESYDKISIASCLLSQQLPAMSACNYMLQSHCLRNVANHPKCFSPWEFMSQSGSRQSGWTIIENGPLGKWTIRENRLYIIYAFSLRVSSLSATAFMLKFNFLTCQDNAQTNVILIITLQIVFHQPKHVTRAWSEVTWGSPGHQEQW